MKTTKINLWAYVLLCSILALLSYFICYHAEWLFGDDYIMMMHSGMGKMFSMGYVIQPKAGRFFPSSYFPWQFLPLFFDGYVSAGVHLGVKAVMLCLFSLIVFTMLKDILESIHSEYAVIIALVATLAITFRIFEDCLYLFSTSPVGFLTVAFSIWMCYKYHTSRRFIYGVLALVGINFFIYTSEVQFIFPLSLSVLILIHGWKQMPTEKRIFWGLVMLSALLYLILYYFIVFRFTTKAYDSSHGSSDTPLMNAFKMFYAQKLLWIGLVLLIVRIVRFLRRKESYDVFFDSLLLSGFALVLGCFILRLNMTSYYYGACIIMLPSILKFVSDYLNPKLVLALFVSLLVLFSYRTPDKIEKSQVSRQSARSSINAIVSLYNQGHDFIWFWPCEAPKGGDEHNRIYTQTYIRYETHDESFDFKYCNDDGLYHDLGSNDIVVYSKYGDSFVDRPSFLGEMNLVVDTGEITFWQLKD